jgi:hypothetical protein
VIFHDTVEVAMEVSFVPPQYDAYGGEIFNTTVSTVPGEVFPLDTDQTLVVSGAAIIVVSRYRMVLAPAIVIPPKIDPSRIRFGWGAFPLLPVPISYGSGLLVDGHIERHMLRGRLHHYELITKNVMS